LPIIKRRPDNIPGFPRSKKHPLKLSKLQKFFYFSTPFFDNKNTKVLVYAFEISHSGKLGKIYILSKVKQKWYILYRATTYVSSF
jgi:hypothetical protein